MSKDDNWIILEEKIFHLAETKPKPRAKYGQLHTIESESMGVNERQTVLSPSPRTKEIQEKDARLFRERRRTAKDAPELLSVDNLSLVANRQGKKLVYQSNSTPSSERFSSCASQLSRKQDSPQAKMSSAFRWPPSQEEGNFVDYTSNTETLLRPLPSKLNSKKVFQEELWPIPEQQSELSQYLAVNAHDEVRDHWRRTLVDCCSDPLPQRPTSREWSTIHEETERKANSVNTEIYKEPPLNRSFAEEGHEHRHPSQSPLQRYTCFTNNSTINSLDNVDALLRRNLTYCRSVPLPQQPPLRTSPWRAAPSPKTPKSAPVQVMPAFQWPASQKKGNRRGKHLDSDSVQTLTHRMCVKDRTKVDFLQPDTLPLAHCPGELKTLQVTPNAEGQEDKVTTENIPEGRKGSCNLLWRRKIKKIDVTGNQPQHPPLRDEKASKKH